MSPFHPFDHIGNAGVTLVIEVVRIIFLLAFLVFLKSSSSSNRSCGQEATARQSNPGAAGSSHFEKLWPPLPEACSSLSRGTTCQQGAEEEQQPSAVSVLQPKPLSSASPRPTCCSPDLPSPETSPILITGRRDSIRGARGSVGALCCRPDSSWDTTVGPMAHPSTSCTKVLPAARFCGSLPSETTTNVCKGDGRAWGGADPQHLILA